MLSGRSTRGGSVRGVKDPAAVDDGSGRACVDTSAVEHTGVATGQLGGAAVREPSGTLWDARPVNVIVVGCGRVGSELATGLTADGHAVTVIDKARRAFRRLPEDWAGTVVQGLGFDRATLERAGIRSADAVAAVTSGDNSNVLTARIAREHYEVGQVVARIYDPHRAVIYRRLGIATVATVIWTTDQITRRLLPARALVDWSDPTGDLVMVERLLPDAWAGRPLAELAGSERLRISAVSRAGAPLLVGPDTVGHEGDLLHVLAHRDALEALEATLNEEGVIR